MDIDSRYVGALSKPMMVTLSSRDSMNYAAALGDNNPYYFDDTQTAGICAPPMFAVALTWALSSQFDVYWGDADFPVEILPRQVHYNESIVWARPMAPDERLCVQGEIVAIASHPSGTLITIRYEARDQRKELVFTEFIGGLFRGVTLTDGGAANATLPVGIELPGTTASGWKMSIPVDPLAAHVYDGCTNIIFPIHTSACFARNVGLPDPIYQGTATLGLAVREILNREGQGDPAALAAVHCGFRGMVFPGTTITLGVHGIREEGRERVVCFDVLDEAGRAAIRDGRVHLKMGN